MLPWISQHLSWHFVNDIVWILNLGVVDIKGSQCERKSIPPVSPYHGKFEHIARKACLSSLPGSYGFVELYLKWKGTYQKENFTDIFFNKSTIMPFMRWVRLEMG